MIKKHSLHTVSVMLLILLFGISIAAVLINGVISYQKISENSQKSYDDRTCLSYINTKVKHYDKDENSISVSSINGIPALKITERIEDSEYTTWIYFYEDSVKELFVAADAYPQPQYGLDITPIQRLDFKQISPDLILVSCSMDGKNTAEAYLHLRSI